MSGPLYYVTNFLFSGSTSTSSPSTTDIGNNLVPVGTILMYSGKQLPSNYLWCNGASYSQSQYSTLYYVIGTTYGGSGTNFNVPNLQKRFPIGPEDTGNVTIGYQGGSTRNSGNSFIQSNQLADHTHSPPSDTTGYAAYYANDPGPNAASANNGWNINVDSQNQNSGGMSTQSGVEFLPPFTVVNYIIKYI